MPTFALLLLIIALVSLLFGGWGYYRANAVLGGGGVWVSVFCLILYGFLSQLSTGNT